MPDFRTADVSAGSVPVAGAGLAEEGTRTSLRLWLLPPLFGCLWLLRSTAETFEEDADAALAAG